MKKGMKIKIFILCLVVVYLAAFFGSIFTSGSVNDEWYLSIKPSITPPNWVFPFVWNILFFLIAVSLYLVWTGVRKEKKKWVVFIFGGNLILNVLWSFLFFGLQNPLFAFVDLILLWASILVMIFFSYSINKKSSFLLLPYFIWVSFAGVLNFLIVRF